VPYSAAVHAGAIVIVGAGPCGMAEIAIRHWCPRHGTVERVDDARPRVGLVDVDAPVASAHVEHIERAWA
jgi:hypothetical protein